MQLTKLVILWLSLFLSPRARADTDSLRAAEWRDLCLAELTEGAVPAALDSAYFHQSRTDDLLGWINFCKQAGKELRDRRNQPRESLTYLLRATEENLWRSPCSEEEWEALAWLEANVGFTYNGYLNHFDEAGRYYERARAILADRLQRSDLLVARYLYMPLGNLKTKLGDDQAAEIYLRRALEIALHDPNYNLAAMAYSDLGVLFQTNGRLRLAARTLREALELPGLSPFNQGLLQGNLALVYTDLEDYPQALIHARSARHSFVEDTLLRSSASALIKLSGVERMLGEINGALADFPRAQTHFQIAENLLLRIIPNGKNRLFSKLYYAWGETCRLKGDYNEALTLHNRALAVLLDDFQPGSAHDLPAIETLYPDNAISQALAGKADVLTARYERTPNRQDLQTALRCHELTFEVEKMLRRSYHYESSKLFNLEESRVRSEKAIALAMQLSDLTQDPAYREQAFAFAERSKSILLLEAFRGDNAALAADIPKERRNEEQSIQAEIARLEKELFDAQAGDAGTVQDLKEKLFTLRQHYTQFFRELENDYPAYYNLRYKFAPLTLAQVRNTLPAGQALVEYFTGTEQVYIFVITAKRFEVRTVARDFPLNEWVVELRRDIEAFQYNGADRQALCQSYTQRAYQLYQKLVAPIEDLELPDRLLIVPSGVLGYLPFDALLTRPADPDCRFAGYPYLLNRFSISYTYSATLQGELAARRYDSRGFVGIAPTFNGEGGFGALHNNEGSLRHIAEALGGEVFSGAQATAGHFFEAAPRARLLQLATHAQANTEQGDFSFIVFAGGEENTYDSLFVKDIYLLDLTAELVVLSACETAVGTVYESEGIISLARGFLYAGARSLITTIWSINEDTNLRIVEDFYRYWKEGLSKDEALRRAKLDALEASDRLHAHPVFWAALAPIGDMEGAIGGRKKVSGWMALMGLPVLVGIIWLGWRQRETAKPLNR